MNQGHQLTLVDRSALTITGIKHVDSFDDDEVMLQTTLGILFLKGEGLNVNQLNLEEGKISIVGQVNSIEYLEEEQLNRGKGIIKKIFK